MRQLFKWHVIRRVLAVLTLAAGIVLVAFGLGKEPLRLWQVFDGTASTFILTIGGFSAFGETIAAMLHGAVRKFTTGGGNNQ